ncbi:hypothetical protein GCM10012288_16630 [Malaciobacter pacificus]|uniref:Uncharacterized protein n=1 Tax=Malaciobacter pacificus TaxID=1080223 RepID=A0A5C2HAG2_9BACT|nr:hypothetical protein [Malaciobacter pacificus]QEP34156.1 hypothetical protein APAC_1030 [Malaciobacter pacificus]GGD43015.1 hypothetical protein GCM10012288_16630 [Malaciobacter pacificus]
MVLNIEEKDGKKYIDGEEILLEIEYDFYKKSLLLLFALIGILIGCIFFVGSDKNIFLKILGIFICIYALFLFFDVLLFKKLLITRTEIKKIWIFGEIKLLVAEAIVFRSSYKLNKGTIHFRSKSNRFLSYILQIRLFALKNYKKKYEQIKKILIETKILKGDEYEWNN